THDTRRVLPGVAFSVEPGIYLPGRFGVRLELNAVMTATGPQVYTPVQREIITLAGGETPAPRATPGPPTTGGAAQARAAAPPAPAGRAGPGGRGGFGGRGRPPARAAPAGGGGTAAGPPQRRPGAAGRWG